MSYTRKRSTLLILSVLALLLAAILLAVGSAEAGDPVLWKQHCPRWYDLQTVPASDWGGVHALCFQQSATTCELAVPSGIEAGGIVLWKQHCPLGYDLKTIPADDWGGVHALCVQQGATITNSP